MLSRSLEKSLCHWGIAKEKVLLVVSDNGAHMIKAIILLCECADGPAEIITPLIDDDEEVGEGSEGNAADSVDELGHEVKLAFENETGL